MKKLLVLLSYLMTCAVAATTVKVSLGQSIQSAINSLPNDNSAATVLITPGIYKQNITINRPNITFKPTGSGKVSLQYSATSWAVVYVNYGADNLSFYDSEIINTIGEAAGNQNTFRSYAKKLALYNSKIVGFGDTVWLSVGSAYFYNVWVEGTVDFIYGQADLYCESCTYAASGMGALTAAATLLADMNGGFVFHATNVTPVLSTIYDKRNPNDHSYASPLTEAKYKSTTILGRPWHNGPRVYFVESYIYNHVKPAGYDPWAFTETELETNTYYGEYGNTGPGSSTSQRVSWAHKMTASEAAPYLSAKTFFTRLGLGTDWIDSEYL